jgi:hypothetical protein
VATFIRKEVINIRRYHGWIYIQRTEGMNDAFYVSHYDEKSDSGSKNTFVGNGAEGAQAACDYFEKTRGLGSVKLLPMGVLGYRVYTESGSDEGSDD